MLDHCIYIVYTLLTSLVSDTSRNMRKASKPRPVQVRQKISQNPVKEPSYDRKLQKLPYSPLAPSRLRSISIKWVLVWVGALFGALILFSILFIKFAPGGAAQFTDYVLRPIIGPARVAALEKTFFNISDKLQGLEYAGKNPDSPILPESAAANQVITQKSGTVSQLDLAALPASYFPSLTGEGVWENYPLKLFPNQQVMAHTFLRPDAQRSYAFATVVELDMQQLKLGSVAGLLQPGGPVGKKGPGVVPSTIVKSGSLVSAFDGGFEYLDGAYGMIVGSTTYLPLVQNMATLVGYTDGSLKLIKYTGQNLGSDIAFVRQNCPMLIEDGAVGTLDERNKALWGRTLTSDIYTWRSGLGITAGGNLLFAVGNNLTPTTLAYALKSAGAVNAMQLDINPHWVRFNIFDTTGNGTYSTTTLMKGITDGSREYLHGYERDFFYVFKK